MLDNILRNLFRIVVIIYVVLALIFFFKTKSIELLIFATVILVGGAYMLRKLL